MFAAVSKLRLLSLPPLALPIPQNTMEIVGLGEAGNRRGEMTLPG